MEQTIVIKIEGCVTNAKREFTDMDDSRMEYSPYARFFGKEESARWEVCGGSEVNLFLLKTIQAHANDRLKHNGYLFLNDVYEMLGLKKSKAGQVVGWVYKEDNPIGDNYVDFDIYNNYNRGFINGVNVDKVLLDFNVDGCILDYI